MCALPISTSVRPFWADIFTPIGQIGDHIFYTDETRYVLPFCSPRPTSKPEGLIND